jgi:hypothetical protein
MSRGAHLFRLPPELCEPTARVKELLQADHPDEVAIGAELCAVQGRIMHNSFLGWLEAELGINDRTAARYMAAAARVNGR